MKSPADKWDFFYFYCTMENYYSFLGLDRSSNKKEIDKRFVESVKHYHKLLNKNQEAKNKFIDIHIAYSILNDTKAKKFLNESLDKKISDDKNPYIKYISYQIKLGKEEAYKRILMTEKELKKSLKQYSPPTGIIAIGDFFLSILEIFTH